MPFAPGAAAQRMKKKKKKQSQGPHGVAQIQNTQIQNTGQLQQLPGMPSGHFFQQQTPLPLVPLAQHQMATQPLPPGPMLVQTSMHNTDAATAPAAPLEVGDGAKASKPKKMWCWKCSIDTHSARDCKVAHYCYVCDKVAHPTVRCPVLKAPRPTAFVTGMGQLDSFFTTLPDSVVRDDLAPCHTPVARIVVTGDAVSADVVAKQVARRCSDKPQWKWEALSNGDMEFLVSLPSFEDLDRVDGIQVGVPSSNSKLAISAWQSAEIPHKIELEQVWLHVDGVPHTVRHFLGLWAVGSLMGKTLDVDLLSLRRRGIVRVLVAMFDSKMLDSMRDEKGTYVQSDVVVRLKGFEFRFRREPSDFVPEPDFAPYMWKKRDEGSDDDGAYGGGPDDAMDTSDTGARPSATGTTPPQAGAAGGVPPGVSRTAVLGIAVTPFNPNPMTPTAAEVVARLRKEVPWLEGHSPPAVHDLGGRVSPTQGAIAEEVTQVTPMNAVVSSSLCSPARGRTHTMRRTIPRPAQPGAPSESALVQPEASHGSLSPRRGTTANAGDTASGAEAQSRPGRGLGPVLAQAADVSAEAYVGVEAPAVTPGGDKVSAHSADDALAGRGAHALVCRGADVGSTHLAVATVMRPTTVSLPGRTVGVSPVPHRGGSTPTIASPVAQPPATPSRRSARHEVGVDGASATDEDALSKAMRRKASSNLDFSGINSCDKSFLSYSTPTISAKLGNVGMSLGSSVNAISVSANALKRMEFDRLKCTPKSLSKLDPSPLDEEDDAYTIADGQLLSHLVGEVSEVGLDDAALGSVFDLTASGRKSKSTANKKSFRSSKKAKVSKPTIVSK
jgi:hypothetical protein